MFPFEGILKNLSAKNAYTAKQIQEIQEIAEISKLDVIPLIQTFGHLEFALKHKEWSKIREVSGSPQAVCPSKNITLDFLSEMITQVRILFFYAVALFHKTFTGDRTAPKNQIRPHRL